MITDALCFQLLTQCAELLAHRQVSPVAITQAYLNRIAKVDSNLHVRPGDRPLIRWLPLRRPHIEGNLSRADGFPYDILQTDIGLYLMVS